MATDISKTKLTGKSRAQKAQIVEQQQEAVAASVAAKITEVGPADVLGSSRGRRPVTGRIVTVPCPLYPEYTDEEGKVHPQVAVGFRVDNQQKFMTMAQPDFDKMTVREKIDHYAKIVALIAHKFVGWEFLHPQLDTPVPVPDPADWTTYYPLVIDSYGLIEFTSWIVGMGFASACLFTLGQVPNFSGMAASLNESLQEYHALNEITIGGPGYEEALERSLPPNSESA